MSNPLESDLNLILDHTRELWEELRGERVFITGGTGFFGCWLLESLTWAVDRLNLGTQCVVLTRSGDKFKKCAPHLAFHPAINLYIGDVRNFPFPVGSFAMVIHVAGESASNLRSNELLTMYDTIVQGTSRTLEFAVHCRARNFLLTSSGAVYGQSLRRKKRRISESTWLSTNPSNQLNLNLIYQEGKKISELQSQLYYKQYGLAVKIARCFAFVGPYLPLNSNFAIGNFISDGIKGGPVNVLGDGSPYRSYMYASDLVVWLWTILANGLVGQPYNVGSEDAICITDLALRVAACFQPPSEVRIVGLPNPYPVLDYYIPSTRLARSTLDLKQTVTLDDAIRRTISWYSQR